MGKRMSRRKDKEDEEEEDASLSLSPNFSCHNDKTIPLRRLQQNFPHLEDKMNLQDASKGEKKNNVQNALNVFHVWLHFC